MADFARGAAHPAGDDVLAVGRAVVETAGEFGDRGREDEDAHQILAHRRVKLLRALPVDVEQHVAAGLERGLDRGLRRAVMMIEDGRPFGEFALVRQRLELGVANEMIVTAFDLAGAHRARGGGDRHRDFRIGV